METKTQWIYRKDGEKVRYVLGEMLDTKQAKSLICIGINPSTATPEALDTTLKRVQAYAKSNGYGAWYMLNVYPQRETDPNKMDKVKNEEIIIENLDEIKELTKTIDSADVWCAWGASINKRGYLRDCLRDIIDHLQTKKGYRFVQKIPMDNRSTSHPLHPIASIKCKAKLGDFDINNYLKNIKNQ
ncbi:MAG: DUF1643 domain-containing protein [Mucinivorans sp.]